MSALPELVVFDLAGTTVRDDGGRVGWCLREALSEAGVAVTVEQVNAVMGIPKPEAIRQLLVCANSRRVEEIHAAFVHRMLAHYESSTQVAEIEGTSLVFVQLRAAGIRVAVDTGFSRPIADVLIQRLGWRAVLDDSITSDEVPNGRPYPDMVLALMARLGITDPRRVAKVGDTPSDLQEGSAAQCGWVIGVTRGSHTAAQLAAYPHTHLIGTVAELPAVFGL